VNAAKKLSAVAIAASIIAYSNSFSIKATAALLSFLCVNKNSFNSIFLIKDFVGININRLIVFLGLAFMLTIFGAI